MITFTGLSPASAGFLLDILFELEDGRDKVLRNVGLSLNYMAVVPTT
jgi:hypothetical protein